MKLICLFIDSIMKLICLFMDSITGFPMPMKLICLFIDGITGFDDHIGIAVPWVVHYMSMINNQAPRLYHSILTQHIINDHIFVYPRGDVCRQMSCYDQGPRE